MLAEEGGEIEAGDGRSRFIIDPLDGTRNFLRSLPHFAISIAAERDGELIAGVVFDPLRDEMFWAEKGRGAYLNRRRLRVSGVDRLAEALIGHGRASDVDAEAWALFSLEIDRILAHTHDLRRMGAAALDLAYVAAGRLDGFWQADLKPWDIAAGIVLVREAGGYVTAVGRRRVRPRAGFGACRQSPPARASAQGPGGTLLDDERPRASPRPSRRPNAALIALFSSPAANGRSPRRTAPCLSEGRDSQQAPGPRGARGGAPAEKRR